MNFLEPILRPSLSKEKKRCRKKFLHYFPGGFTDDTYIAWERGYKWQAHLSWEESLHQKEFVRLLSSGKYAEIAARAIRIESRTNLLFSFEKMALRDAVRTGRGAKQFASGLFEFIHGGATPRERFEEFAAVLTLLPRRQTRVHTWPLATVFGFLADPKEHIFLKPRVTQAAAMSYGYPFYYEPKPNWVTYESLLGFAHSIRKDNKDLKPKDMIDLQSFIWVLGSEEYPS
jgi:hypothetical protein